MTSTVAERPAAVAGLFYPAAPDALRSTVRSLLDGAAAAASRAPKILIVPHAGYIYSGQTAASGFALLRPAAHDIRRVVLVGPAHRVAVRGMAVPTAERFATPLGSVPVDRAAIAALTALPTVVASDLAHAGEHALEVQLPFLQQVLAQFTVVPIVVGSATPEQVADVLRRLWGGDETLLVVSSDLSHYLGYDQARAVDGATLRKILSCANDLDHAEACGATPINAAMRLARESGLSPQLVAACNSGDTAGDRDRVVGYAAIACYAPAASAADAADDQHRSDEGDDASVARGKVLLAHARHAVQSLFATDTPRDAPPEAAFLDRPGATFVTLRRGGELRGCIGSLEAERSLRDDVARNARAAATLDPRFPQLAAAEVDVLTIEVSLLHMPKTVTFDDEADLARQLSDAREGVVLEYRGQRATFLPQVWEQFDDGLEFLRHLKAKAGLAPGFWSPDVRVARYAVEKWSEP